MRDLKSLKYLRTLHIRNLPALQIEDGRPLWPGISEDERSEAFVTRLGQALVRLDPQQPPNIETIALGVVRHYDICGDRPAQRDNERMDDFLKLRVYHIEYRHNFQGDCIPIVTLIAKGTTDAIQGIYPNIEILQSDWLV